MLSNRWVRSFIGKAKAGNLLSTDIAEKTHATAYWLVNSLQEYKGVSNREYIAIRLKGDYYDQGAKVDIKPHIEVPQTILATEDPFFPDKVAQCGLALHSPLWVYSEIKSLKNNIFTDSNKDTENVIKILNDNTMSLRQNLTQTNQDIRQYWSVFEGLQTVRPEELTKTVCTDMTDGELHSLIETNNKYKISATYDKNLLEKSGGYASRRIGVWKLKFENIETGEINTIAVVTPRLTFNSMFTDTNYDPKYESGAASLMRIAIIYRLSDKYLQFAKINKLKSEKSRVNNKHPKPTFKMIIPQIGHKMPEPSIDSVVNFVQTYVNSNEAYKALSTWSVNRCTLTVSKEDFEVAFNAIKQGTKKAETLDKNLFNDLLPLAWSNGKVVRVTFSKLYDI